MIQVARSTMDKLALSKEMYLLGCYHGTKNTRTNRMLSILNFDFSIGTIIVTTCNDNNLSTKNKQGHSKDWHELIDEFKKIYNNSQMIADLNNLHDVRNLIQHGGFIPSEFDIKNYANLIKNFIDDICKTIYQNQLSYESISIASVLKSTDERVILLKAEEFFSEEKYQMAQYYLNAVLLYHYMLIQENLNLDFVEYPTGVLSSLAENVDTETPRKIAIAVNRLAMGEYYIRLKELLLKYEINLEISSAKYWLGKITPPKQIGFNDVKEVFNTVYNIILETEHQITEQFNLSGPLICGLYCSCITHNSCIIKYGLFSEVEISKIELYFIKTSEDKTQYPPSVELSRKTGFNEYIINGLIPNTKYHCGITVKQKLKPNEFIRHDHTAEIVFETLAIPEQHQKTE